MIRDLELLDYYFDYCQLLYHAFDKKETVPDFDMFKRYVDTLPDNQYVKVCIIDGFLAGSASITIENKLLHGCKKVGHIEDVFINPTFRGRGIGKKLIQYLLEFAKNSGCYKCILNCDKETIPFYQKCGMEVKEVEMVKYFFSLCCTLLRPAARAL